MSGGWAEILAEAVTAEILAEAVTAEMTEAVTATEIRGGQKSPLF